MSHLQRFAVSTTVTTGLFAGAYLYYTSPVRAIKRIEDTPSAFQAALQDLKTSSFNKNPTWGFYTRSRLPSAEDLHNAPITRKQEAFTEFTQRIFGSKWYKLEAVLSGAKEVAQDVQSKEGEKFGNMKCIERHANEAVWHYVHPAFNFSLFFGAYDGDFAVGFIEVNGDMFEDLGSRFLLPMLLEDAARKEKRKSTHFERVGSELSQQQLAQLKQQLSVFKENLESFSIKYRNEIRSNPQFRAHFQSMCASIGVDPLASNKGFWAEVLGVGDFYYELAVQIAEICIATREKNGGLIDLQDLKRYLEKSRGKNAQQISDDDIAQSIKSISTLGNGFEIVTFGSRKMVQSVPRELNKDYETVLAVAQESGFVTRIGVERMLGWNEGRVESVLTKLLQDSVCWIDLQAEPHQYWVAGFFSQD
ncbi:ESCRT-II subunit protein snf8 [Rhizoclosmatium hyalinum]|nr:ESCRT-II subunit protein snf8 [Rhizoclosmatium hyalinum]